MPLSRIEIEQLGPGRWVAEVEAGSTSAVRRRVMAPTFDDVMMAVVEAHAELTAPPAVKTPPVLSVRELETAQSERIAQEVDAYQETERARHGDGPPERAPDLPSREELLAEATRRGVDVDRRWGTARLQEAVDAAKAGAPPD